MDENVPLFLGSPFGKPLCVLPSARFDCGGSLPGAWLAAYNPLDGAMLLTADPPAGFIGVNPQDLLVSRNPAQLTFTCINLAGLDLRLNLAPDGARLRLTATARNHTRNPLPISLAFSWQDLRGLPPRACLSAPNEMTILNGDGSRIRAACLYPRTRFSHCLGWDPDGGGEEVWDDYFACGDFGNQQYASTANALSALSLVAAARDLVLSITLDFDHAA